MNFADLINALLTAKNREGIREENHGLVAVIENYLARLKKEECAFDFLDGFAWGLLTSFTVTDAERRELWEDLMERKYGKGWKKTEDADGTGDCEKTL